jgi:hypothetical protein
MFVALLAHAGTAELDCLEWQDASGTQINGIQHRICQRVGARRLSYIPCVDLV